jgi:hypothetical protein
MFARPPQVDSIGAGLAAAIGLDECAVNADVVVACGFRGQQCGVQARGAGGEHVDGLV